MKVTRVIALHTVGLQSVGRTITLHAANSRSQVLASNQDKERGCWIYDAAAVAVEAGFVGRRDDGRSSRIAALLSRCMESHFRTTKVR